MARTRRRVPCVYSHSTPFIPHKQQRPYGVLHHEEERKAMADDAPNMKDEAEVRQ